LFLPLTFDWSWSGAILGHTVYQDKRCGALSLPHGSFPICESLRGQISEITKNGTLLRSCITQYCSAPYSQYNIPSSGLNGVFRAEKYAPSNAVILGHDLTPQGLLENENSISDSCALLLGADELRLEEIQIINPVSGGLLHLGNPISAPSITIFD
jgi:hypothetical protein